LENGISYLAQTVKGAAEMLMEEQVHPEQLIDRVTTLKAAPLPDLMKWKCMGLAPH
jgi:pyrroline-5-carboxylate reductase